ncbi:hypothetical protein MINS_03390 [Mycolicibacterium insubricum]|uniref:Uncharacterized protein n=1 Tax=Mycolicibacterium insubricum TaxID=444597 RepID=A0A1X0DBH8_9MYCO|nr:hypothetical protein [Mycolicibacterium insubricum]MCV7082852.1 hypothetical protein [Mycolicibacterium insubricum]ORA69559.1 hypothetical protein BST26_13295 [Mycolicibacterium insubricum]BBZ64910.1 hypothetical protein MINS_03390 [Mycolicibacterium insubricum]
MARDAFYQASANSGVAIRLPCGKDDDFASVWKMLTPHLQSYLDLAPADVTERLQAAVDKYEDIVEMADAVTPDCVARGLKVLANSVPLVVILDEFDRIGAWDDTVLFADLIKMLSDDLVKCTVFIVGVADNVAGLLAGHASIDRALRQVHMPRMRPEELHDVVVGGFDRLETLSGVRITLSPGAINAIVKLSQGFPYYTHLLAGSIGELALRSKKYNVTEYDVFAALVRATSEAAHSIRVAYTDAVASVKPAQFGLTLLACALAEVDELGFFAPANLREPLSELSGKVRTTPSYLAHLKRFADAPLYILDTRGEGRKSRYRFHDPLMKPFVMMKGLNDGIIKFPMPDDSES